MARLTEEQIKKLEGIGFNRWTKYGKDRLYASEEAIGLSFEYYNTGNVSGALLEGERISNSKGVKIAASVCRSYIDAQTGKIFTEGKYGYLIQKAMDKAFAEE